MSGHYLNQRWNIVNFTIRNKIQWNINRNSYTLIHENAFDYVVCKTVAILSRPQCVKKITETSSPDSQTNENVFQANGPVVHFTDK